MLKLILLKIIWAYRYFISPLMAPSCRFTPSCSDYAMQVIEKHGFLRGTWLSIKRVLRCNPWHPGGYDPAP